MRVLYQEIRKRTLTGNNASFFAGIIPAADSAIILQYRKDNTTSKGFRFYGCFTLIFII